MFNQVKKSYLKIDQMVRQDKPIKPQRSTGLLGRMSMKDVTKDMQQQEQQQEPMQRVAKIVREMRQARMELKNGRE